MRQSGVAGEPARHLTTHLDVCFIQKSYRRRLSPFFSNPMPCNKIKPELNCAYQGRSRWPPVGWHWEMAVCQPRGQSSTQLSPPLSPPDPTLTLVPSQLGTSLRVLFPLSLPLRFYFFKYAGTFLRVEKFVVALFTRTMIIIIHKSD